MMDFKNVTPISTISQRTIPIRDNNSLDSWGEIHGLTFQDNSEFLDETSEVGQAWTETLRLLRLSDEFLGAQWGRIDEDRFEGGWILLIERKADTCIQSSKILERLAVFLIKPPHSMIAPTRPLTYMLFMGKEDQSIIYCRVHKFIPSTPSWVENEATIIRGYETTPMIPYDRIGRREFRGWEKGAGGWVRDETGENVNDGKTYVTVDGWESEEKWQAYLELKGTKEAEVLWEERVLGGNEVIWKITKPQRVLNS